MRLDAGGRAFAVLLAAVAALASAAAPSDPTRAFAGESVIRPDGGRDFELKAGGGDPVPASWWYEPEPNGPGAVLVATTKSEREEWTGVVRHLRARGMNVLAVVVPPLAAPGPDPLPLVGPAGIVAEGASFLVKNAKCDPARIGVAAIGVGAVAAMEALRRHPGRFRAAVLAGPDLSRFQASQIVPPTGKLVPSVLVMEHTAGVDPAVKALADAIPGARRIAYDDAAPAGADPSWTRTFAFMKGVPLGERTVASFLDVETGAAKDDVVLDGIVDEEAKAGGPWTKATAVGSGKARVWAYRAGKRLVFGGYAPASAKAVRLDIAGVDLDDGKPSQKASEWFRRDLFDVKKGRVAWTARVPIVHIEVQRLDVAPTIRAVPCEGGVSFEGEWSGTAGVLSEGGRQGNHWRVLLFTLDKLPAAEKSDPSGNLAAMVHVAPR